MRRPTILIGLGSGREGWLSIDLNSPMVILEIENGKRSVWTITLAKPMTRHPNFTGLAANMLAGAVRSNTT
jgi:hypothetical protein